MSPPGPFAVMVKNWKVSSWIVPTFSYGLWYLYDYTSTRTLMKTCCQRAASYGDQRLNNAKGSTRHITVILNPVAGKGKSKKLYEKWVEPIFHLSGIKVSLVETKSRNEAYELMKIMNNCDGVAIVGGDGTVHEAINGLLHRPDRVKAARDFPIAIIPTGEYNSIARYLHQGFVTYRNRKEFLIGSATKLIDSTTTKFDALKIVAVDEKLRQEEGPIYALRDVRYGLYQDNFLKLSGFYYYQTLVKPLWLRIRRHFSSELLPQMESISFTDPCEGCKNCFERHKLKDDDSVVKSNEQQSGNSKWWTRVAPINRASTGPSENEKRELELSRRDNPVCGKWTTAGKVNEVTDFRSCMMGDKKVRLSLGRAKEYTPSEIIETQDVRLVLKQAIDAEKAHSASSQTSEQPTIQSDESKKNHVDQPADTDLKKKPVQYLIDGQPVQAHSIEVTALHEAVTIFTGPHKLLYEPMSKDRR